MRLPISLPMYQQEYFTRTLSHISYYGDGSSWWYAVADGFDRFYVENVFL